MSRRACISLVYFNPRPREEGDKENYAFNLSGLYFNPRPREEGDGIKKYTDEQSWHFNPRPREEGDSHNPIIIFILVKFQSTPA